MKKIYIFLTLTFLGVFLFLYLNKQFALSDSDIPLYSVPDGKVRIDFINKSSEEIGKISIAGSAFKLIKHIKQNERRTLVFTHSGEGTIIYTVEFASGRTLKGTEHYIERGFFIRDFIYDTLIKTKY